MHRSAPRLLHFLIPSLLAISSIGHTAEPAKNQDPDDQLLQWLWQLDRELTPAVIDVGPLEPLGKTRFAGFTVTKLREATSLDLDDLELFDRDLLMLGKLTKLETLQLRGQNITNDGLAAIKGLQNLKTLDLEYCSKISSPGVVHLAELKSLESLNLSNTSVDNASIKALASLPKLKALGLALTGVNDAGLRLLQGKTSLKALDLFGLQGVTTKSAAVLASLTNLQKLECGWNRLDDRAVKELCSLEHLQELGLSRTNITDAVIGPLVSLESLRDLSVNDTSISDRGLAAMRNNSTIVELDVRNTQTTTRGMRELLTTQLQVLHVSRKADLDVLLASTTIEKILHGGSMYKRKNGRLQFHSGQR